MSNLNTPSQRFNDDALSEWDRADVVVVGGGAAGFFTALSVKSSAPKARVCILESASRVLSKVSISGGGRCNVTHACFDVAAFIQNYPRFNRKLAHNFHQFGVTETVEWFARRGMPLVAEADGRMFPTTNTSETIVTGLQREAKKYGVPVITQAYVTHIDVADDESTSSDGFTLHIDGNNKQVGRTIRTQKLVLATGGSKRGYPLAEMLGHELVEPKPSLFTFCIPDTALHALAGVSVPDAAVSLSLEGERPKKSKKKAGWVQRGPVLVTHWGMSGPAVLKLSAWGARDLCDARYQAVMDVDWFPDTHDESLRQQLIDLKKEHGAKQIQNWPIELPQRLWVYLLEREHINVRQIGEDIPHKALNGLAQELKHGSFRINGKGPFKEEFVTSGGVALKDIDLKTYESKKTAGMYVVGELLNVDGVTGGFNFQNAWTSAHQAGQAIAYQLNH